MPTSETEIETHLQPKNEIHGLQVFWDRVHSLFALRFAQLKKMNREKAATGYYSITELLTSLVGFAGMLIALLFVCGYISRLVNQTESIFSSSGITIPFASLGSVLIILLLCVASTVCIVHPFRSSSYSSQTQVDNRSSSNRPSKGHKRKSISMRSSPNRKAS